MPAPEIDAQAAAFRRFNRFYTPLLGLLEEQVLKSGFSLTEGRVLFELARRGNTGAKEIGEELNVDAGYLSRILRKLEDQKLLTRTPLPADARHAILRLTKKGKTAFAELDRRSTVQAQEILESLTPAHRTELIRSMQSIESSLRKDASARTPFVLRPHRPGDMGWVIARNAAIYAQEYGWDGTYEALVARICTSFIENFDPARERCWIADRDGEPLGCIFLVRDPEHQGTAKLRLLLVEPTARGLGLGKALVNECVRSARLFGYKRMTLWTQSILKSAHRLYEQAGFHLADEKPHHSFGVDLLGQTWNLEM
jgi:DNA-binding MarR family transcriptional regulator/GNAT superfamily N-acetyltransferase